MMVFGENPDRGKPLPIIRLTEGWEIYTYPNFLNCGYSSPRAHPSRVDTLGKGDTVKGMLTSVHECGTNMIHQTKSTMDFF